MLDHIPDLFVWSKIGVEAGQPLKHILHRKELERQVGGGFFAWGIGTSLPGVRGAAADLQGEDLPVLFSPMLARPKRADTAPEKLILWLGYEDENGCIRELPPHLLITSRGSVHGTKRHYALFCTSSQSLLAPSGLELDATLLRNAGSGRPLGFSQVTSLVRHKASSPPLLMPYDVAFAAVLQIPFHVVLAVGVEIPPSMAGEISKSASQSSPAEWNTFVTTLRHAAKTTSTILMLAPGSLDHD